MVANDDGGSIFATLEQGAPEHAASYDLLFGTPHGVDLAEPVRRHPYAALAGHGPEPSSSTRWPAPTAASRSSRPWSGATTGASWTSRSAAWPTEGPFWKIMLFQQKQPA